MIQISKRHLFILALVLLFVWWNGSASAPGPFAPQPDRPILRALAKIAKNLLWIAIVAEGPPSDQAAGDARLAKAEVGEDGYQLVDHGRGW